MGTAGSAGETGGAGYDGWIMFGGFSTEQPQQERLQRNLAWLRELIA